MGRAIVSLVSLGLISASCGEQGSGGGVPTYGGGQGAAGTGGTGTHVGGTGNAPGGAGGTIDIGSGGSSGSSVVDAGGAPSDGGIPEYMGNSCPGELSPQQAQALAGAPRSDQALVWLYPYDGTVWPRGLLSPILQWPVAIGGEAVKVHFKGQYVDLTLCLRTTGSAQVELPQGVWDRLSESNAGATDPIAVELVVLAGGAPVGPIKQAWTFANAKMKGAVYYNTYNSKLPAAQNTGAVLRLIPGQRQPEVFLGSRALGECTGCHSVSANGTRLSADTHGAGGVTRVSSAFFALTPSTPANPPPLVSNAPQLGFGTFYPDGSRFVTNAAPALTLGVPFVAGNLPGTFGVAPSELITTASGQVVQGSGLVTTGKMPSFSASGKEIVFVDYAIGGDGKGVAIMDFDAASNKFSNYRIAYQSTAQYPAWPFFLADGSGIVFALGNSALNTSTNVIPPSIPDSELYLVDLRALNTAVPLARANGYRDAAQAQSYVPAGARDLKKNYLPTAIPVAAGGYFWMLFTSRRTYGNIKTGDPLVDVAKQLWVSALAIGGSGDISYPPFYLRGQELESGNIRGFAALEPCRAEGASCSSGIDCCNRFCTNGICGPPETCSPIDQGCVTRADCCPPAQGQRGTVECIGGFCAFKPPDVPR